MVLLRRSLELWYPGPLNTPVSRETWVLHFQYVAWLLLRASPEASSVPLLEEGVPLQRVNLFVEATHDCHELIRDLDQRVATLRLARSPWDTFQEAVAQASSIGHQVPRVLGQPRRPRREAGLPNTPAPPSKTARPPAPSSTGRLVGIADDE